MAVDKIRHQAALAVGEILEQEGFASLVIDRTLKKMDGAGEPVSSRDRRFFTSLVYAVVKHQKTIDAMLSAASKTPLKKVRPYVLSCLRIGAAQLFYMDGVKPYAAISESVELVKKAGFKGLAPYVNGVLRSVQRDGQTLVDQEEAELPEWILSSLEKDYGPERKAQYLAVMDYVRPVCLRLNLTRGSRDDLLKELNHSLTAGDSLNTENSRSADSKAALLQAHICPAAVYVQHPGDISRLAMYQEGRISVQDESSMAAVMALAPEPGDKVLDLCAAPGGKSAFCGETMRNEGEIHSRDIHPHRVKLIEENAERLGLTLIRASVSDAMIFREEDREQYDRVLLDAPCSGLGILRSKRDIALNHQASDSEALAQMQETMLENAAKTLKKGGRLVYSTCTLTKRENDDQVERFLKNHPEFTLIDLKETFPMLREEEADVNKTLTLWPVEEGHDGFFVAAFVRRQ